MRKNVKKFLSVLLVLMMALQVLQPAALTVKAAETTGTTYTNATTDIKYVYYEDISEYRSTLSYPEEEGYVFAGWWTGITSEASDKAAGVSALSTDTKTGAAWAKYVPEDVLTVKAQVSKRVYDVLEDGTVDASESVKLRLVTSVDDNTKYSEIGFKVKVAQEKDLVANIYESLTVRETEGAKTVTPDVVFHAKASAEFATLVISGFSSVERINETEVNVTPYWKTLDGTTVYGASRSRLLVSDDRASDTDGTNDITTSNSVYTYNNTAVSAASSYQFFEGASDTVYLKGSYTTTGSADNYFGISVRNGGQTRQIYFDGVGVKVLSNEGLTDGNVYNTVNHTDLIYVWSQSSSSSVVADMLSTAGTYDVIWAIEKNVLYCNVTARGVSHTVFSIPMYKLCADWELGRYYQFGLASYNSATQAQALKFTVGTLAFGKDAKNLLITEKNEMPLDAYMCYEPITGSYMAASKAGASYRYGVAATTAQAMKTTIYLADANATTSSTGITVRKTDGQSAQILLTGNTNTTKMQFDHQTVDAPIDITSLIPGAIVTYDAEGKCEVTVVVKDGMLYILYNGVQAGSIAVNKIVEGYKKGDALQLGLFAWDTNNGLSRFSDVQFLKGDAVNSITTTNTEWKNFFLTDEQVNVSVDQLNGTITNAASQTITRVQLNDSNTTWEISGKLDRTDGGKNQAVCDLALMLEVGEKWLRIDACYQGFSITSPNTNETNIYRHGDNELTFNPNVGDFFGYLTIGPTFQHITDEIYFKFVIANDRLYALYGADENNLVPSWNIPLDEKIVDYAYNSGTKTGTYNDSNVLFDGFASGSSYKVKMYTFLDAGVDSKISNLEVNMGDMADTTSIADFPTFQTDEIYGTAVDNVAGTITNNSTTTEQLTRFADYSKKWEVSGKMVRTDATSAENWNFGFNIISGDKTLRFDAVNQGIVFEAMSHNARYPYHAFGETVYNLNTDIKKFISAPREASEMNFKAVIANDIFYLWTGFEGEEMKLSWVIPLAEALYQTDGTTQFFEGFTAGSTYNLGLYAPKTTGQGGYTDVVVKTGDAVDTLMLPGFTTEEVTNATVNGTNGTIASVQNKLLTTRFAGESEKWEVIGKLTRTDDVSADSWNFGFNIKVGEKVLRFDAVNQGMVFEESTHNARYPYHAFKKTIYNLNTDIAKFISSPRTQSVMNFRVVIADDTFYAWFGPENGEMKLSWVLPLDEVLYGAQDSDHNGNGIDDSCETIFDGFATGSKYNLGFYVPATSGQGKYNSLIVNTGDEVNTSDIPETLIYESKNADVDMEAGTVTNDPTAESESRVQFLEYSNAWEISGSMVRTDSASADSWCPGFTIKVGNKELTLSAVSEGIVFNQFATNRYGYHAVSGVTEYNLNTDISKFLRTPRQESVMNFKAMLVNDMFYVWYGFEGEDMKLSWVVPLDEGIYSLDGKTKQIDGFASGSRYNLGIHVMKTTGQGQFRNLVVKTGAEVDTTVLPKFLTTEYEHAEVNAAEGTITSEVGKIANVRFVGNNTIWEVSGTVNRTDDADAWCPGFSIKVGDKELTLSAVSEGIVFNQFAPDRYAYHAISGVTAYNLNTNISQFLREKTQSSMNFKAIIANDTLYVWYGFEGEEMILSWKVPLAEGIYALDGTTKMIDGFASGSRYNLGVHVMASSATGNFSNVTVKTGNDVDLTQIAGYE